MSFCANFKENLQTVGQQICSETDRRNFLASITAGTLFFIGWWIIFDAAAMYPNKEEFHHAYHICGVVATLALIMVNSISAGQLRGDHYTDGCFGPHGTKIWLFLGLVMSFASLIGSCWILFGEYVVPKADHQWPGVAIFLQNVLIFMSSVTYKFGRSEEQL